MKELQIFLFIFVMWILILVGGGILISILGPISINGYGQLSKFLDSAIKAIIAILLVIAWIYVLSKIKNWIFHKQMQN